MLDFAKSLNPTYVFWLGDNENHEVDDVSVETNIETTTYISENLREKFGPDQQFYVSIGNHESHPVGIFDNMHGNDQWVLNDMSDIYNNAKLISDDESAMMKKGGYYSAKIPDRNVKVISIFSTIYDSLNTYLILNIFDPLG